jgi:hypothetical protein
MEARNYDLETRFYPALAESQGANQDGGHVFLLRLKYIWPASQADKNCFQKLGRSP